EGLHHVCILVDDMKQARKAVAEAGGTIAQEGKVPGGGEVVYVDTSGGPGTMVEILKPAPGGRDFFTMMRIAAKDWDGKDPVRKLG
ncbi:MAG: VOC family protein, partial [Rhizomicrobium sp.]